MRHLAARLRARRRWLVAAAVVAFLVGLGFAVFPRDRRQAPVSVREVVVGFRAEGSPATPHGAPPAGVYVYDTTGYEDTRLLGGARHRYPPFTTVTVSASGCGVLARWDALDSRWTRNETCPRRDGAWRLRAETDVHKFFGHRDERTYRCTPRSLARPIPGAPAGTDFGADCSISGTAEAERGVVVGRESVAVAGRSVAAVHLRVLTTISGDTTGTGTTDLWLRASDGLILRKRERNRSRTPTFAGTVRYTERYDLRLRSLLPRR